MSYLNQVTLIGNLGRAPVLLSQDDSGCFVRLSIATTRKSKNAKGNEVEYTEWHKVYVSNGSGQFAASYLKKGDKILIVGELKTKKWTDKQTGEKKSSTAVYAFQCQSLMPKPKNEDEATPDSHDENVDDVGVDENECHDDYDTCSDDEYPTETRGASAETRRR